MTTEVLFQSLVSGLTQGCIYALVGLGFTIVYAVTGIINFAQGEFVMLGGMLSYVLASRQGSPYSRSDSPLIIAMLIGALLYLMASNGSQSFRGEPDHNHDRSLHLHSGHRQ